MFKEWLFYDNSNFDTSIFRSLCEFVGDCFLIQTEQTDQYISWGPPISHHDFKKDVTHLLWSDSLRQESNFLA